jgi:hypothetical protein
MDHMPRFEPPTPTGKPIFAIVNGADAVTIHTGADKWALFADSYKTAADSLATVSESEPWRNQLVAAPIMFLYRHYVELQLKSLLLDAGELLDDPQTVPPKHYILTLWNRVRALLLKISPESDGEWFTRADRIISDIDGIDPTSFSFRYPVDTEGQQSLPTGFTFDPTQVKSVIAEIHLLLDGAQTQIDIYQGLKYETYGDTF